MAKSLKRSFTSLLFLLFATTIVFFIKNRLLNDDIGLELCYSGYFTGGTPVSDHLFQHFFLTKVISFLYTYFKTFNWYFYLHLFFLVLSFYSILNILINCKNKYYVLIIVCILFFFEYRFFTYTRISFYVTFSGFLFYLKYNKLELRHLVFSFGLVFLGSVIRPENGILVLIFFSLLLICDNSFKKKISDKLFLKHLVFVLVIPLITFITHHVSNKENSKRFLVSDINITESKFYKASSFDNEIFDFYDFKRLKGFYFDERFNNEETLNYINGKAQKVKLKSRLKISIDNFIVFCSNYTYKLFFIIILIQIIFIAGFYNKIKYFLAISSLVLFLISTNVLLDLSIYKGRVFQPLFSCFILVIFTKNINKDLKFFKVINGLTLIILSIILLISFKNHRYIKQSKHQNKEIEKLLDGVPLNDIIFDVSLLNTKIILPGSSRVGENKIFKNHQFLPYGWGQRSYSSMVLYEKMNVKRMDDIIILPNVSVLIDTSYLFLWNNYGEKYLSKQLIPYDTVCINSDKSCYYLAKYKSFNNE